MTLQMTSENSNGSGMITGADTKTEDGEGKGKGMGGGRGGGEGGGAVDRGRNNVNALRGSIRKEKGNA
jgi:hypothetical protein